MANSRFTIRLSALLAMLVCAASPLAWADNAAGAKLVFDKKFADQAAHFHALSDVEKLVTVPADIVDRKVDNDRKFENYVWNGENSSLDVKLDKGKLSSVEIVDPNGTLFVINSFESTPDL